MTLPHDERDDITEGDDQRRPYRPPVGMPLRGEARWGAPFSIAVHVVLILLLITPLFAHAIAPELFPGGGFGPAGGGGGGRGGSGGWRPEPIEPEGLRYVRVAPEPPPAETTEPSTEVVPPPVPKEEPPPPLPEPPADEMEAEQPRADAAPVPGTGGGTGNDGTAGTGPGSGGGTGSGVGTGTGSANGPGTGGGAGLTYGPAPDFLVFAPTPIPRKARGKTVVATFEIDAYGKVIRFDFTPTGDRGYDKRLRQLFGEYRFRPAVDGEGRPIAGVWRTEIRLGSSG